MDPRREVMNLQDELSEKYEIADVLSVDVVELLLRQVGVVHVVTDGIYVQIDQEIYK
jgi:hypothetical protein